TPAAASPASAGRAPTGGASTTSSPMRCAGSASRRCSSHHPIPGPDPERRSASPPASPPSDHRQPAMATQIEAPIEEPIANREIHEQLGRKYDAGFVTDIESDSLPPGLDEDVIRALSAKKDEPEWMTEWRLAAYRHWLTMPVP